MWVKRRTKKRKKIQVDSVAKISIKNVEKYSRIGSGKEIGDKSGNLKRKYESPTKRPKDQIISQIPL